MRFPPIVYVGPTIAPAPAERLLPGLQFMPPVRRGDLYLHRMMGFSFFVILDGVFFGSPAIPPREIIDVIEDGATVIGASSMGAIRAAECWPAGMRGIGAIYRLFRRGILDSDDEVAVTFPSEQAHRYVSVALVNVRFAVSRATKTGLLTEKRGQRIVRAAEGLFYADRNWRLILDEAGVENADEKLLTALRTYDLKEYDAVRALSSVARILEQRPELLDRNRASPEPFQPNDVTREQPHDPLADEDEDSLSHSIWEWLLVSGRYRRLRSLAEPGLLDAISLPDEGRSAQRSAVFPKILWNTLKQMNELDAIVYRYLAIKQAASKAAELGMKPRRKDEFLAETEILIEHGFSSWERMKTELGDRACFWSSVERYKIELGQAKRMREYLFRQTARNREGSNRHV